MAANFMLLQTGSAAVACFGTAETDLFARSRIGASLQARRLNLRAPGSCKRQVREVRGCSGQDGGSKGEPPRKRGGGDKGRRRYDAGFPLGDGDGGKISDCAVPREQQPVNEYQCLTQASLFPWATDDFGIYVTRLAAVCGVGAIVLGWPISAVSINSEQEPFKCALAALSGGIGASTLVVLRLYLGWAYVGNRLFSATVEYEETGWYDGEVWVKPPEVLARDRLIAYYKVKPALRRLKLTLICLAVTLFTSALIFSSLRGEVSGQSSTETAEESETTMVQKGTYSDDSAHYFEPKAFVSDGVAGNPLLDYCHGIVQSGSFPN